MRRVCCTYHCGGCDGHFASLAAFDLHRQGSYRQGTRHCVDPDDLKRLIVKTDEGHCDLRWGEPLVNAVVFQTADSAQSAQRAWGDRQGVHLNPVGV